MGRLRTPWTRQPQQPTGPDWSNPLSRGLKALVSGIDQRNVVTSDVPVNAYTDQVTVSVHGKCRNLLANQHNPNHYPIEAFSGGATLFLVGGLYAIYEGVEYQPLVTLIGGGVRRLMLGETINSYSMAARVEGVGSSAVEAIGGDAGSHVFVGVTWVSAGSIYVSLYQDGRLMQTSSTSGGLDFSDVDTFAIGGLYGDAPGGVVGLGGFVQRAWSVAEIRAFSSNPWQLFAPLARRRTSSAVSIFAVSITESVTASDSPNAALTLSSDISESVTVTAIESAVNSVTRPNSDVTTTGWTASTGSDLYAMIDESIASDTDYITSPDLTSGASTTIHGLTQSLAIGTYTVRFRSEKATAPTRSVRIHLMDGSSTIVGSSGWQAVTASYALYEVSITTSALATRVGIEAQ